MDKHNTRPGLVSKAWLLLLGLCLLASGLFFAVYGYQLVALQGSWYFLISGMALVLSGLLIAAARPGGAWLYALTLLATAVWAVADVGLDFWPLVSHLLLLAGIGILVALSFPVLRRA
ncbi:MAG: membrane-bound PQQ-dependent dehydrogenase, glucose/quinate/shikimate family, partial [Comamonas sp.]|nr:membrane-bound PQQ-dependent dehydrogenase, glucose/quinate/shikimate family [Comamonas sp.]